MMYCSKKKKKTEITIKRRKAILLYGNTRTHVAARIGNFGSLSVPLHFL